MSEGYYDDLQDGTSRESGSTPTTQLSQPTVSDMLRLFQSSMEEQFQTVTSKLDSISERMNVLEKSQASLEEQMSKPSSIPSSTTPKVKGPKKRKRLTPVAMQVSAMVMDSESVYLYQLFITG